jgi:uncharacterized protein YjcR
LARRKKTDSEKEELKLKFLEVYRETGLLVRSAQRIGISSSTIRAWRKDDPVFNEQVQEAEEQATERLRDEVIRRAVEGIEEPVFDKNGVETGTKTKYSDLLLMFELKRRDKNYRDRVDITSGDQPIKGYVGINVEDV